MNEYKIEVLGQGDEVIMEDLVEIPDTLNPPADLVPRDKMTRYRLTPLLDDLSEIECLASIYVLGNRAEIATLLGEIRDEISQRVFLKNTENEPESARFIWTEDFGVRQVRENGK